MSIKQLCADGLKIAFDEDALSLKYDGRIIHLKRENSAHMWYFKGKGQGKPTHTTPFCLANANNVMDINEAHDKLGHPCKKTIKHTLEHFG